MALRIENKVVNNSIESPATAPVQHEQKPITFATFLFAPELSSSELG